MHPTRDIISAQEQRTGFLLKSTGHKALGFDIQLRKGLRRAYNRTKYGAFKQTTEQCWSYNLLNLVAFLSFKPL